MKYQIRLTETRTCAEKYTTRFIVLQYCIQTRFYKQYHAREKIIFRYNRFVGLEKLYLCNITNYSLSECNTLISVSVVINELTLPLFDLKIGLKVQMSKR